MTYFVLGVMMYGAGLTDPGSLGIVDMFFDIGADGSLETDDRPTGWLGGMGNTIEDVAAGIFGPALAIWDAISGIIGALFWPVTVLLAVGAPTEIVLLLGGTAVVAFFLGTIRIVRTSV